MLLEGADYSNTNGSPRAKGVDPMIPRVGGCRVNRDPANLRIDKDRKASQFQRFLQGRNDVVGEGVSGTMLSVRANDHLHAHCTQEVHTRRSKKQESDLAGESQEPWPKVSTEEEYGDPIGYDPCIVEDA